MIMSNIVSETAFGKTECFLCYPTKYQMLVTETNALFQPFFSIELQTCKKNWKHIKKLYILAIALSNAAS